MCIKAIKPKMNVRKEYKVRLRVISNKCMLLKWNVAMLIFWGYVIFVPLMFVLFAVIIVRLQS